MLVSAGLMTGIAVPRSHWAARYLGAVLGQLGYELAVLQVGPLAILGAAFLLVYSLIFLLGSALGAFLARRWRRLDGRR